MSFPKYPEYKDSGVEWLGQVPSHWDVRRLKWAARLLTQKLDTGAAPVALENIESWSGRFVESDTEYEGQGTSFERGDILFGKLRPYLAKVALAEREGEAVGDFHVLRPQEDVDGRFLQLQMLTRWFISVVDGSTFGAKMPRASWDFMSQLEVAVPPHQEQRAIASFLDRETGKIDALVTEQEKLICLLKEKRQAVISHAVTKGLDPNAPMKDSGVEWLEEVPEHWSVVPLKWFARSASGAALSAEEVESEREEGFVPVIGGNGVMGYAPRYNEPDPILVVGRVGALCGNVHYVDEPVWVTDNALVLKADQDCFNLPYLCHALRARNLNEIASKTAQPLITGSQVRAEYVPKPPLGEQKDIVRHLELICGSIDSLMLEAQKSVKLLKERRLALISAAVTGKIDVRSLLHDAPPTSEALEPA